MHIGSPFILDDLWIPWELAMLGVFVCASLGLVVGTLRGGKHADNVSRGGAQHRSRARPHEE